MSALLEVAGLTKRYGEVAALSDVAFSLNEHEILGIIGPNGAGKTTLLECVAGLLPADSGRALWRGEPLPRGRRKNAMFYMPDGVLPYADQRVCAVLAFYAEMFGRPRSRAREVVKWLELEAVLDKRGDELSKGYRRRLLLATALIAPQPLLLLDEPFDGFDLRQTLAVMSLVRDLVERGCTMLLSIHQLTDAERICDRFLLLHAGRVLGAGTLTELRDLAPIRGAVQAVSLEEVLLALT